MDFVKWVQQELASVPYILLGIVMLIGSMFISDIPTSVRDQVYKKDD